MKKICIALMVLCLLMTMIAPAFAASLPSVSFAEKKGSVNGGMTYELTVQLKKAQDTDLTVDIVNNTTADVLTVTIPAGEKTASVQIPTEPVDSQVKVVFSFAARDDFKAGDSHTLTIVRMPVVEFYRDIYMSNVGKELTVRVTTDTSGRVVKGSNVYQLRDTDGTVLDEKTWKNGDNDLYFKFTVTEEHIGRHSFSVWLGDYKVSEEDGYGAIRIPGSKVVSDTETELPVMSFGIDCMYNDEKTDEILAVLEKHNVKITFFMAGHFMKKFPESVQKILDAGHEIATHTDTHPHLTDLEADEILEEVYEPIRVAEENFGVTPRLLRPPYGAYNGDAICITQTEGMEVIRWSFSFGDSSASSTFEGVMRDVNTMSNYYPGSIGLCHLDGEGQPDSLDAALTIIEEQGLTVIPISALLYASGKELPAEPAGRNDVMVYTNEYWATWIERNLPELLAE